MSAEPPVVRVVRGSPTDEEAAALVAVLAAVVGAADRTAVPARGVDARGWASPAVLLRSTTFGARAGGWRASGMPR